MLSNKGSQNEKVRMSVSVYNYLTTVMVKKPVAEKAVWLICLAVLLTTMACTSATDTTTVSPTNNTPLQDSEPTATSVNNSQVFFPQQEEVDGEREAMTGEIFGTLVTVENCIRVNANESDISYLLIWPPDYAFSTKNDAIQILNGDSKIVARVGDKVRISGGEITLLSFFDESVQKELPPNCMGPYWIVGDEVNTIEISKEGQ